MGDEKQSSARGRCRTAALLLSVVHALSVAGMAYQSHPVESGTFALVNFSVWLSPAIVLVLFRDVCTLVASYAAFILAIFFGRVHFAAQFYAFGTNSVGHGDWAWWLATIVGMISVAVLVVGLIVYAIKYLGGLKGQSQTDDVV